MHKIFAACSETFYTFWKLFSLSGNFPDCLKNVRSQGQVAVTRKNFLKDDVNGIFISSNFRNGFEICLKLGLKPLDYSLSLDGCSLSKYNYKYKYLHIQIEILMKTQNIYVEIQEHIQIQIQLNHFRLFG